MNTSRIIMGSTCSMQRHPDEYNRSSSKKNSSRGNVSGSYIYLYLHIFGRVRVHISHFDSHSDSSLLLLPSIHPSPSNYLSIDRIEVRRNMLVVVPVHGIRCVTRSFPRYVWCGMTVCVVVDACVLSHHEILCVLPYVYMHIWV